MLPPHTHISAEHIHGSSTLGSMSRWGLLFIGQLCHSLVFLLAKITVTIAGPINVRGYSVKAKIYGVLYNQSSFIALDETSSYWSALKSS